MPPQVQFDPNASYSPVVAFDPNASYQPASMAPQAHAEMTAHPGGAAQWFRDLESDLRFGGEQTVIGRGLKAIGYQGSESLGGMEGTAGKTIVSPLAGPAHAAAGVADVASGKGWQGTKEIASGVADTATIPGAFMAPEVAETAAAGAGALVDKAASLIPSAAHAGEAFQDVMSTAKNVPVNFENSQDAILKMMDWQKKTQLGPTINKFLNRVTNPKLGPLTYEEARDYYQLLGKMSADEQLRLAPPIKRTLAQMVSGLKTDIGDTAEVVGKSARYYQAMQEFRNAKRLEDISDATKEVILEGLKRAVPLGFGGYVANKIYEASR